MTENNKTVKQRLMQMPRVTLPYLLLATARLHTNPSLEREAFQTGEI